MIKVCRLITLFILMLLLSVAAFVYIQHLSTEAAQHALSEAGPFERLSLVFWPLITIYIIWRWWPGDWKSWSIAILPLIAMAREASLHKMFYGISIMKRSFYVSSQVPTSSKFVLGGVVLVLTATLLYGLFLLATWLRQGAWRRSSGQFLLVGLGLLLGTKILDRLNAVLRADFGIALTAHFAESLMVLEESLEMALPLVLLAAARFVWLENKKHE